MAMALGLNEKYAKKQLLKNQVGNLVSIRCRRVVWNEAKSGKKKKKNK